MIGDIIVFHPPRGADPQQPVCAAPREGIGSNQACGVSTPRESKETFVERVVGVAGDKIKIINGHVIRNGLREHDPYIAGCGRGAGCNFRKPIVIPRGRYFTLGDNRGESDDGRFWGPIHRSWILGKVVAHT
jgi:signal peptidase I